jgi:hypothetical protein
VRGVRGGVETLHCNVSTFRNAQKSFRNAPKIVSQRPKIVSQRPKIVSQRPQKRFATPQKSFRNAQIITIYKTRSRTTKKRYPTVIQQIQNAVERNIGFYTQCPINRIFLYPE